MEKDASFVFYGSYYECLKELDPETRLKFYESIMAYGLYDIEPELTGVEKAFWMLVKNGIDRAKERYRIAVENGKKGGRPPKNRDAVPAQPKPEQAPATEPAKGISKEKNPETKKSPKENSRPPLTEREPVNDIEAVEKVYLENWNRLKEKGVVKTDRPVINWGQSRKLTRSVIDEYGLESILLALRKSVDSDFCVQKGYCLTTILSSGVLAGLINGNDWKKTERPIQKVDNPEDMGEILF